MQLIRCDGSPGAVAQLCTALQVVLDGGEPLAPLGAGDAPPPAGTQAGEIVVTTSGSSGEPKRVRLSAAALRASAEATHARLGGPGHWLLALPAQHIAGLQVLVRSALAGSPPAVLDLRAGFDPGSFAATARLLPAGRRYTSLVSTQLVRLLEAEPDALAAFDAVLVGGAAAPAELLERARASGARVVTTYGMTETCGGCVYDGHPLDGVRVRVEGAGAGRIALAGPVLAQGYLDRPGDPALRDGWFRTDDLGRLERDGRLRVLGRADEVIITGGVKVAPAEVEAALQALPGVADACVVGLPDAEWGQRVVAAVAAADPARPPDPAALLAAARRVLSGAQTPKQVVLLDALPLHGIGKPDRRAVVELLSRRA